MREYCPECHEEMGVVGRGLDGNIIWACIDVYHCGYKQADEVGDIVKSLDRTCRRDNRQRKSVNKACYEMLEVEVDKEYIANELKLTIDVVGRMHKELKENAEKAI